MCLPEIPSRIKTLGKSVSNSKRRRGTTRTREKGRSFETVGRDRIQKLCIYTPEKQVKE